MTTPVERKKVRFEGDAVEEAGDNRRAGDPDGNKTAGDGKEPGVTEPTDESSRKDQSATNPK